LAFLAFVDYLVHSKRNTDRKLGLLVVPQISSQAIVRYLRRDFSTLNNLNMFVFANICDCALRKTVYNRSIESIDGSIETHLCYA